MSTLTDNLGFVKPELTDAADITVYNQNWDKADAQLGSTNIQSYTELSQMGFTDDDMSPTDFMSNIDKIITTLDDNAATVMLIVQSDINPNLHASLISKLNGDTSITFTASTHAGWLYIRFSGEAYRPTIIETNLETANYYDSVWTCVYNKGADSQAISRFRAIGLNTREIMLWEKTSGLASFQVALSYDPTPVYDHYLVVTNYGTSVVYLNDESTTCSGSVLMGYNGRWELYAPEVKLSDWTFTVSGLAVALQLTNGNHENVINNLKFYKFIGVKPSLCFE